MARVIASRDDDLRRHIAYEEPGTPICHYCKNHVDGYSYIHFVGMGIERIACSECQYEIWYEISAPYEIVLDD